MHGFIRLGGIFKLNQIPREISKESTIQNGGHKSRKIKMAILAWWNVELNWILFNRFNWAFYSAFFYKLKVTVESFDFSAAARTLSIVARRFDKVVLTAEWGSWVGTQFSASSIKSRDSLRFRLRNSKSWWTRNLVLMNCQRFPSNNRLGFLGSYITLRIARALHGAIPSARAKPIGRYCSIQYNSITRYLLGFASVVTLLSFKWLIIY